MQTLPAAPRSLSPQARPLAMIIESQADLAEVLQELIEDLGFDVLVATTHCSATTAIKKRHPQLLLACVPASAADSVDAYLAASRREIDLLPTLVMVDDPAPATSNLPRHAARLLKPFTAGELLLAVDGVLSLAAANLTP